MPHHTKFGYINSAAIPYFPYLEEKEISPVVYTPYGVYYYPFFSSHSTFPRVPSSGAKNTPNGPIYSSPQSHRVLPREHKQKACRMRAVCIRDLICITILAYVFCRRSLRRYVGTQQVPYALGVSVPGAPKCRPCMHMSNHRTNNNAFQCCTLYPLHICQHM